MRREVARSVDKKACGKKACNVVGNANRSSVATRLCRCVVPLRQWPRMNSGGGTDTSFNLGPYFRSSRRRSTLFCAPCRAIVSARGMYRGSTANWFSRRSVSQSDRVTPVSTPALTWASRTFRQVGTGLAH